MVGSNPTMKQRYRRLTDLFVTGKAVRMPDGTHLWIQAVNDFERDEALNDAQVTRARIILALKSDGGERVKVMGRLAEIGRDRMIEELVTSRLEMKAGEFVEEVRADPEWAERMEIILKTDWDSSATSATPEETAYLVKINSEVITELTLREGNERDFQIRRLERMSDEDLVDEWVEQWLERRGADRATAEYRLTELAFATRFCAATLDSEGQLDHNRCEGHRERVFDTKNEARSMPNQLQALLRTALDEINVAGRDPKGSASKQDSSASPPPPSGQAASTPSTSTASPATPPGT